MTGTQHLALIGLAKKYVLRYREDAEEWQRSHEELKRQLWAWEGVAAQANFVFGQLMTLDTHIHELALTDELPQDRDFDGGFVAMVKEWLDISLDLLNKAVSIEADYGPAEGAKELHRNVREAKGILTSDDEFFSGDKLAELRDRAVEAHRDGLTEPLR